MAVLPDSLGGHRDPNNVERLHRLIRRGTPFEWVAPHTHGRRWQPCWTVRA